MDNIDQNEVKQFNEIASKWWDPEGEFKPLHDMNPLRLEFINSRAHLNGKRVLDVGCGGGILTESLAAKGATAFGIDAGDAVIQVANLHKHESNLDIDYQVSLIEDYKVDQPFDVITCMEMVEHVPDPESIVKELSRLIKPSGDVFLSTINRNPKSYLFAIVGAEYVLRLLPRGTHDYAKFVKPSEMGEWLRKHGFEIQSLKGIHYNPITKKFKMNGDVSVNYIVHAKKL